PNLCVISKLFRDHPKIFWFDSEAWLAIEEIPEFTCRVRTRAVLQGGKRGNIPREASIRDTSNAERIRHALEQFAKPSDAKRFAVPIVPRAAELSRRLGADMQHDVIAEARQLIVRAAPLEMNFNVTDPRQLCA